MVGRVLVTGVTGFVGRNVVAPLRRHGFEVHGISRQAFDLLEQGGPAAAIDRTRPSHLLHLAWVGGADRMHSARGNLAWARASLALFEAFVEAGGRRAVFAGSCAEYDWHHELLIEDTTPSQPGSIYGVAKNSVREIVRAASAPLGVSSAWARLFFLYGPHEPAGRLVPDICSGIIAGKTVELSSGSQERDYLHVEDAAEALALLLAGDVAGTVNVASGTAVPVRTIAEMLARAADRRDLLAFGRRPAAANDPPRLVGDITRLRKEVGFEPRHRLEEGLAATLRWWREQ